MKKSQIIAEVLAAVRKALDEKLEHQQYSEYLRGSVSFRLDVVPGPEKRCVHLDLPPRGQTPKPLQIEFKRRYRRRQVSEPPSEVNDAVES